MAQIGGFPALRTFPEKAKIHKRCLGKVDDPQDKDLQNQYFIVIF